MRSYGEGAVTGFAGDAAVTAIGPTPMRPPAIGPAVGGSAAIGPTAIGPNTPPPIEPGAVRDGHAPLHPGQAFGPRYHIIRMLGAGGMGAVYQAWDAELGVAVAIKVIRPEAMADGTGGADIERRFKRELLLARQVTHKNVVRIHDIGQIDGIKYITMSYVDGVDLATALQDEGRLPIAKVLQIARSVAAGLAAAHAAGVVHRDLKPANIMLQADGTALIMDFGIARSTGDPKAPERPGAVPKLSLPRGAAGVEATMAGVIVGTVEYMAPEQARGEAVDQRADVYAFGLILYDLLAGRSRAHPDGAIAELQARMNQVLPVLKTTAPQVPEALNQIVMRCIDPNPAGRFQSATELLTELDRIDERGKLIPVKKTVRLPLVIALAALLLSLSVATWWFSPGPALPAVHDPVSVVIADFQNSTSEPGFDPALEQTVKRALEDATFVSAYDRSRIRSTLLVQPPDKLDEEAARAIAIKQGLGVVVSGSIDRRGNGYELAVKAVQAVTGEVISSGRSRASSREQVLEVVTRLVSDVRTALGDETSESDQLFAMRSVSATSLDVVTHYASAMESQARGRYEESRQSLEKAIELDPKFGLGYQGLAVLSRNLGRLQESDKYIKEALSYLEGMTERERFATRGFYVRLTGDYQQCVKEFGEMIARFSGDAIAYSQLALCWSKQRDLRQAVDNMRQALRILPNHPVLRGNLAIDAAYGGDFPTAEQEAKTVQPPSDLATLSIAFAQLGQGRLREATETYQTLASVSARGKSWSTSGLGDLALYEGRFADAARLFAQAAAAELDAKSPDKAARKLTSLAYAHLLAGRAAPAVAAAEQALANSQVPDVRFLAGRILAEAGELGRARELAATFASELAAEPRAYGKIIEGVIALKDGDPRVAVKMLLEANGVLDTWLGHFDLGRAYLQARAFVQADSEFDSCIKRRGEALALLIDEEPTYGYFPTVYYYQGRVREQLKNAGFAESYRAYLGIRGKSTEDPLLPEVRKRVG